MCPALPLNNHSSRKGCAHIPTTRCLPVCMPEICGSVLSNNMRSNCLSIACLKVIVSKHGMQLPVWGPWQVMGVCCCFWLSKVL